MAERTQEEKLRFRNRVSALALAVVAIPAALYVWQIILNKKPVQETQIGPSEPVFQTPPPVVEKAPPKEGDVLLDRATIVSESIIASKERFTAQFTMIAQDTPATIRSVTMPFARDYGITLDANQCFSGPLEPGRGCVVNITYDPDRPNRVDGRILIEAISTRSDGSSRLISKSVSVQLASQQPPAPVAQLPQGPGLTPNNDDEQNDFLRRRQRMGLLGQQQSEAAFTHMGPQRPKDDSWSKIGFKPNMSTFPVDLSRTVTMDKPIPAVLKLPIDARAPGRAVATVERDIYGGDGRLVVIERGSTLIGTVASTASTGEEKLGISWQRIVRPDGAAFAITATSGDAMGRAGVPAYIDNRFFDRFGRTVLFSVLQGGITAAVGGNTVASQGVAGATQQQDARSTGVAIANQTITPLIQEYMREQLALPPIRTVPVGTRLTVFPTTDIVLRPIDPNEEMKREYAAQQRQSPEFQAQRTQLEGIRNGLRDQGQFQQQPQNPQIAVQPNTIPLQAPPNAFGQTQTGPAIPQGGPAPADASASFATQPTANQQLQERTKDLGRQPQNQSPFFQTFTPNPPPVR